MQSIRDKIDNYMDQECQPRRCVDRDMFDLVRMDCGLSQQEGDQNG